MKFSYSTIYRGIHSGTFPASIKKNMRGLCCYKRHKQDKKTKWEDVTPISERPKEVNERKEIANGKAIRCWGKEKQAASCDACRAGNGFPRDQ